MLHGPSLYSSSAFDTINSILRLQRRILNDNVFPHYVIHLVATFIILFSSHTQIALRVSSGMPLVWWTLAEVCFEKNSPGVKAADYGSGGT